MVRSGNASVPAASDSNVEDPYGACSAALDAFHAADNPLDGELVADLERMVDRTRVELERLAAAAER